MCRICNVLPASNNADWRTIIAVLPGESRELNAVAPESKLVTVVRTSAQRQLLRKH